MKMYLYVQILLFCAITVFKLSKTYENLALNKNTEQSTTKAVSNLAVDNNTDQRFGNCARTEVTSVVWWRVDLGDVKSIHDIRVFYRNDSDRNVPIRLDYHSGFALYVSNSDCSPNSGYLCYQNNGTVFHLESDHVCTRHGRYVTYYNKRQTGGTTAELCEVQVFGCASAGVYGENCTEKCPINCRNNQCDIVTGACLQCIDGWKGDQCDQNSAPQLLISTPSPSNLNIYRAITGGLFLALVFFVGSTIALLCHVRKLKATQTKSGNTTHTASEQDTGYVTLGAEPGNQYSRLGVRGTEHTTGEDQYTQIRTNGRQPQESSEARYTQIRTNGRQPQESSEARGSQTSVKSIDRETSDHHYSQLGVNRTKSQESNSSYNYVHIL